ncbi:hypothetical protein G3I59_09060 [Amycolatopsis rubida]|uniref:Uncharacterized protein n=1 Tax=Amycolatopsis rubida TaxID=112413 RepID=A0ABX0BSC4_9PSEU|nr:MULTISPECIES: hypothetical protein [Amycolatopsis]NEC55735.1 hypothetical protein [Amycolatopsis rubida]OAP26193.1 hypothetical protein A4R44_03571 [Amycolatopsis sp. M39]
MLGHQDVASVNPTATHAEQLANIRQIYLLEHEALGVVAIGIELADPLTRRLPNSRTTVATNPAGSRRIRA